MNKRLKNSAVTCILVAIGGLLLSPDVDAATRGILLYSDYFSAAPEAVAFETISWISASDGFAKKPGGGTMVFKNELVAGIVYFQHAYFEGISSSPVLSPMRGGIRDREIVLETDPLNLESAGEADRAARDLASLEVLRQKYPSCAKALDLQSVALRQQLDRYRRGERKRSGAWLTVSNIGERNEGEPSVPETQITLTMNDGRRYEKARVTAIDADTFSITHAGGVARIRFADLPVDQSGLPLPIREAAERRGAEVEPKKKADLKKSTQKARTIPNFWLQDTDEARWLRTLAQTCFPEGPGPEGSLATAIERLPGIDKKSVSEAATILENCQSLPHGIQRPRCWYLFAQFERKWDQAGLPSPCLLFLTKEFSNSLVSTKVDSDMSGTPLNWDSTDAEKRVLLAIKFLAWATKQPEVRQLIAFGSLVNSRPWEEAMSLKLASGNELGDSIKQLKIVARNEDCFAIGSMLATILPAIPPLSAFSEANVNRKSRTLTGPDLEGALNAGFLEDLTTLQGRDIRCSIARRVANSLRGMTNANIPKEICRPDFIRTLFADLSSPAMRDSEQIASALAKYELNLPASELSRIGKLIADASRIAQKDLIAR